MQTFQANLWESRFMLQMRFERFYPVFDEFVNHPSVEMLPGFPTKAEETACTLQKKRCLYKEGRHTREKTEAGEVGGVEGEQIIMLTFTHMSHSFVSGALK